MRHEFLARALGEAVFVLALAMGVTAFFGAVGLEFKVRQLQRAIEAQREEVAEAERRLRQFEGWETHGVVRPRTMPKAGE